LIVILEVFFTLLTSLMIAYLVRHYIFTMAVLKQARKRKTTTCNDSMYEPTVTILIPARDEEDVLGNLLQQITELTYPKNKLQVIVIDDGSLDGTGRIADRYARQCSLIEVLHREKNEGGKGKTAAMNAGYQHSKGEIILCLDADYTPQRDIIEELIKEFKDPKVGAVQGRVVVINESQNTWTRLVTLERIGGYRVDQEGRDILGLITQFGGTVGGFRRSLLEELGGWDEHILAEDTDLTFRVYLAGYRVSYVKDAECYEEAVDNVHAYWTQRYRWARGHMQCCFKHFFSVLKSKKLSLAAKIDGLFLLNIYFMPLIVLISMVVGIPLILLNSEIAGALWFSVPVALYSFVGNFAPFFEVGVGTYLDGRKRIQWLIPLLMFTYIYNISICAKACIFLVGSKIMRRKHSPWAKTSHQGTGSNNISYAFLESLEGES
jgi:cellulose synthase/poly-beta-1,6-N-acetylglucosamine synthase-like glycosyltransferase